MKTFTLVLRYVCGALVTLVALVFTVLEATLLVTLDFALYENVFLALVQLLLRLAIASLSLALGMVSLVQRTRSFLPHGLCLLASSVVMIPFVSNSFGVYFTVVAALFLLSQWLWRRQRERLDASDAEKTVKE